MTQEVVWRLDIKFLKIFLDFLVYDLDFVFCLSVRGVYLKYFYLNNYKFFKFFDEFYDNYTGSSPLSEEIIVLE